MGARLFCCLFRRLYPYVYPYGKFLPLRGKVIIVALHPRRRVLHHLFGGVSVDVQSEASRGVAEKVLDALDVRAAGNSYRGCCVPEVMGLASGLPMPAAMRLKFL